MHFGTARAFLVYAGVDGLLLLSFFVYRGLRLNGHQTDRELGGTVGTDSLSAGGLGAASPPPIPLGNPKDSAGSDQTFLSPATNSQSAPR